MALCGDVCLECRKGFRHNAYRVSCSVCEAYAHIECVNISVDIFRLDYKDNHKKVWSCVKCAGGAASSTSNSADVGCLGNAVPDSAQSNVNKQLTQLPKSDAFTRALPDVMAQLNKLRDDQREVVKTLKCSQSKLDEVTKKLDDQSKLLESLNDELKKVQSENSSLQSKVIDLKLKCANLEKASEEAEQYSRRNTLEIRGVPCFANESPVQSLELVKSIGRALNLNITSNSVDYCHRLKSRTDGNPPSIVVKFVRRFDARAMLNKRRVQRSLSCKDLKGLGDLKLGESTIYIHPSLTAFRSKLRFLANTKKKALDYKWLWVTPDGDIKMRKTDKSRTISIRDTTDLDRLDSAQPTDTGKMASPVCPKDPTAPSAVDGVSTQLTDQPVLAKQTSNCDEKKKN